MLRTSFCFIGHLVGVPRCKVLASHVPSYQYVQKTRSITGSCISDLVALALSPVPSEKQPVRPIQLPTYFRQGTEERAVQVQGHLAASRKLRWHLSLPVAGCTFLQKKAFPTFMWSAGEWMRSPHCTVPLHCSC